VIRNCGAILLAFATFLGSVGPTVSAPEPLVTPLEPGQTGIALTATVGNEIEEIPLTYIGKFDDFAGPGYDLHLVRLEGPLAERVGVANGMSGSPVYIDGKLIGALSYRMGTLPTEAIAGVTPIEDILDAHRARGSMPPADGTVVPIQTPVVAAGMTGPVLEWLRPQLEELGFQLTAGGSGAADSSVDEEFRPGSPIGVALVRGDLSIAATGTVTWVEDDLVYAFGHPFFGTGRVELPMLGAEVIHILADMIGSSKWAKVGKERGAIIEDRLTAVVGRRGVRARMVPLNLTVRGADYGERVFHYELARSTSFGPLFASAVVANSLVSNTGFNTEGTLLARGKIRLRDLPDLPLEMAYAGDGTSGSPVFAVAVALRQYLETLWNSPLGDVEIEGIDLDIDVAAEARMYRLEALFYDRGPVAPGEMLEVRCLLRQHGGGTLLRTLQIEIPEGLTEAGPLLLTAGSPDRVESAVGRPLSRRLQSSVDVESVVRTLSDVRSAHRLTAALYRPALTIVHRGASYSELPSTAERLLSLASPSLASRRPRASQLATAEIELDGPLSSGVTIRLSLNPDLDPQEER